MLPVDEKINLLNYFHSLWLQIQALEKISVPEKNNIFWVSLVQDSYLWAVYLVTNGNELNTLKMVSEEIIIYTVIKLVQMISKIGGCKTR